MSRPVRRLCVLWARLGPYHVARLRALHASLAPRGVEVVALETASEDAVYAFGTEAEAGPFRRETLFPGASYQALSGPAMEAATAAALDALAPDAVAIPSYSTPDARAALAWCRRHRRVAVMLFDSRAEDAERAGWREAIKRAIVRQFDAALVAGTPQRAYAEALGIPPAHVFQPLDVVDNDRFAALAGAARRARPAGDARRFLLVSRLTPRKGADVLVEAFGRYRAQAAEPWDLVVVGDGPERPRLEAMAGPGVRFEGVVRGDAVGAWYGRADAAVLPSLADPWGLVVNEAMAAGLPVVVSDGAGCAVDLVAEGANGLVVPAGDAGALAAALGRVAALADAERAAWGERSREVVAGFGLDAFADGLWAAVEAGRSRADRGLGLAARLVLGALRLAARRPGAFHAVPD